MMSTKMICGLWSAILASASNPSVAVTTSAPSRLSKVSAVRRIVLESSITITRRPSRLPVRLSSCVIGAPLCAMLRDCRRRCETLISQSATALSSFRWPPRLTERVEAILGIGRPCYHSSESAADGLHVARYRHCDGPDRVDQDRQGLHVRDAAGGAKARPSAPLRAPRRAVVARRAGLCDLLAIAGPRRQERLV